MLLKDATSQAAVDLFLRNLSFDFPATDIVGIPGDFVGLQAPHSGDKAIVFLHELEHIHSLTHPLGVLFSALGQRVLDLRNDLATRFKNLPDKDPAIQDVPEELMTEALFTVNSAADWCEFRLRINMTVKLLQPLLEGLAMMTQMEGEWANDGWATLTILTLENLYYEHRILLGHPELAAALNDEEERKIFVENLLYALERQVSYSRAETLDGNLVDTMFFEEGTGEVAPYFYGYLYLRRLYQEWAERIPELNFSDFYYLASKLVCSVIPLTLLPLYSLRDIYTAGDKFPLLFEEILRHFLSLPRSQIELLRSVHNLQIWNIATHQIEELREQDPLQPNKQADYEAEIITRILGHVFDLREKGKSLTETLRVLDHIERAKFLFNTGKRYVLVLGVDEEQHIAFIVDVERKSNQSKTGQINFDRSGSTFFKFQDATVFQQFLELVEGGTNRLKRQQFGSGFYKFSAADYVVPAWLETFCYLWPYGVPSESADDLPAAAAIVRVLFCGEEPNGRGFISGPPIRDLASVVKSRYWINKNLLEGIRSSLDRQSSVPLEISAIILHTYGEDSIAGGGARAVLRHYEDYESSPAVVQSACDSVYGKLLFPACSSKDATELSRRKLNTLIDDLQEQDRRYLTRWMNGGLVLHPERGWLADGDTEEVIRVVDRIRQASSGRFGIPLVRWNKNRLRVELDLIPNH